MKSDRLRLTLPQAFNQRIEVRVSLLRQPNLNNAYGGTKDTNLDVPREDGTTELPQFNCGQQHETVRRLTHGKAKAVRCRRFAANKDQTRGPLAAIVCPAGRGNPPPLKCSKRAFVCFNTADMLEKDIRFLSTRRTCHHASSVGSVLGFLWLLLRRIAPAIIGVGRGCFLRLAHTVQREDNKSGSKEDTLINKIVAPTCPVCAIAGPCGGCSA